MLFMVFLLCGVGGVHHMLVVQSLFFVVGSMVLVVCWWLGPCYVLVV